MPQMQYFQREPSAIEKIGQGFGKRLRENQIEERETQALEEIYRDYKKEGQMLEDTIQAIQTKPGLSPTTRVNTINQLINAKKINTQLQKNQEAEQKKQEYSQKEKNFANRLDTEGKNWPPSKIYSEALKADLDRQSAQNFANLNRYEQKEGRLSLDAVKKEYDPEIASLNKQIQNAVTKSEKEKLKQELDNLKKQRNEDIGKWKRGEKNFNLDILNAMVGDEEEEDMEEATVEEKEAEQLDPISEMFVPILMEAFPPEEFKGEIKYIPAARSPDGKKHAFKSDGKTWILAE